jgi:hypothetical protein
MRGVALLLAAFYVSTYPPKSGVSTEKVVSDTLPEHVVQRGEDAFNHHDAKALGAVYAPQAVLSFLSADSSHRTVSSAPDSVAAGMARYWGGQKVAPKIRHLTRISAGPFVAEKDQLTDDRGASQFLDIYEVRGGLIVHEWQEPQYGSNEP